MKTRLLTAALLAAAACHKPPVDGGLVADIRIDAMASVTCVELVITDTAGANLVTKTFATGGKNELKIGINQAGDTPLPDDIKVRVTGSWSTNGCTDAKRNSAPTEQPGHFTAGSVETIDFTIRPPTGTDDGDGDGYIGVSGGGPDCDDTKNAVHPNAQEACTMVADNNCNGKIGCDDPACAAGTCIRPASALAFSSAPQAVESTRCSMAIVVESRDDQGARTPVQAATTVTLAEMGALGLQFFSDSGCTLAASSLDIAKGASDVRFYARTSVAGMSRVQATATGYLPAQQDYRVNPGPPVSLTITSAAQTVKSDACSRAVVLESRDLSMNAAPVSADVSVTLSGNPTTGFQLYSDPSCSAMLAMPKLASGTSTLTFYFKATRTPGMVTLSAAAMGLGMTTQNETVIAGDPARIAFVTLPQTVTAGACSGALTLKLQDALMTDTTAPMPISIALSGPTMTFFTDSSCGAGSMVTSAAVPAGAGATTVHFIATGAGMPLVTASGAGLMLASQMETVIPAAPVKLGFTSLPQGLGSGACSGPLRLSTLDAYDNPSNVVGAPLAITMSASPPGGFTFYSAPGCGTPLTAGMTSIPVGANGVSLSFRGNTAGTVTMTADSALNPDPTQVTTIGVNPPSQLVYLTTAQTQTVNTCSGAVTLEARDPNNNRSNVSSPLTITLVAAPAMGFQFYSDSNCTTAVTQVTLPASSAQVSFYWLGTAAGPVTMTPASSLTGPGPQVATVRPGAPASIAFTTPPRTIVAGTCSTAGLQVQSRDAFGNPAPVTADTPLALSGANGLTYYADSLCAGAPITSATIVTGQSSVTFYARGTIAPSYNITAQHASVGLATQPLTITPAGVAKLVITTAQQTLVTGQCSNALTVERRDAFDNAITGAAALNVTLTAASGVSFYATGTCPAGAPIGTTSIPMGSSTVSVLFRGTLPGTMKTVTGTPAMGTAASQDEIINVAPPTQIAFSSPPQMGIVAGEVSGAVTVESRDPFGNPSAVTSDTPLTLTPTPTTQLVYCGEPTCVTVNPTVTISAGTSTTTFYFRDNVAHTFTLTATSALGSANQSEQVVSGAASQLQFTSMPQTRGLGSCSTAVTVQRQDGFNNPVTTGGMISVGLMANAGAFTFHSTAGCMTTPVTSAPIAAGASTATFYFNGTTPGQVQVTASSNGLAPAVQTETLSASPASQMAFITPAQSVVAGGACSGVFTVESRDSFGNTTPVMSSQSISLSAPPAANITFFSDVACTSSTTSTTIGAGGASASFWLKANGTAATHTLTAQNALLGMATQPLVVDAGTPTQVAFTNGPFNNVPASACLSTASQFVTRDALNNVAPLGAMTSFTLAANPLGGITFWSDAACTASISNVSLNAGQSAGSFYLKGGSTLQPVTVTVTPSVGSITAASQMDTVTAGPPAKLVYSPALGTVMAGQCLSVTVLVRDAVDNPTTVSSATTVTLGPATGVTWFNDGACGSSGTVSIPGGQGQVTFSLKAITGGTPTITATGASIPGPASAMLTVLPAVRTGTCTIASGQTGSSSGGSTPCAIAQPLNADLSKTFFLFQATSAVANIDDTAVSCALTSASLITCSRAGNTGTINIRWYTVSRFSGLFVQHASVASSGALQTFTIPTAVNPAQAFVLMSTSLAAGGTQTEFDDRRWSSVRLASGTSVEITRNRSPDVTLTHSLQIVEWTGAAVDRPAMAATLTDNSFSTTGSPSSSNNPAFLLYSWRFGANVGNAQLCDVAVRGAPTNNTTVTFFRGLNDSSCNGGGFDMNIDWERVRMPSQRIEVVPVNMAVSVVNPSPIAIPNGAIDVTRTLAFFGATSFNGQSMGEATDLTQNQFCDSLARASFPDASTVQVSRETCATGNVASQWTLFVWQVVP